MYCVTVCIRVYKYEHMCTYVRVDTVIIHTRVYIHLCIIEHISICWYSIYTCIYKHR